MKPALIISLFSLLFIGCGEEEKQACFLSDGDYSIKSMIKSTDCPKVFGEPSQTLQDNGTVWSLKDVGFSCGETYQEDWVQQFLTGPCECYLSYKDTYHTITTDSFSMDRKVSLVCLPYYDPKDTGCNKECVAEGVVHGEKQ
jgi:hypothetical protein